MPARFTHVNAASRSLSHYLSRSSPAALGVGSERPRYGDCVRVVHRGSVQMTRVVIDLVLFSCMSAFVIGIVIAAANLLI
jgi:hypothetical protein